MVVVNIGSGLGNQLFQYAAGRALSLARDVGLVGDPIAFAPRFKAKPGRVARRLFALGGFRLPIEFRSIPNHVFSRARGYARIRRVLRDGLRPKFLAHGTFDAKFVSLPGDVLLDGYFQDRRYFLGSEARIVDEIGSALLQCAAENGLHPDLPPESSLAGVGAVHVRRDDYRAHPEFYPDWFDAYYRMIVPYLIANYDLRQVHVFSDDPEWCQCAFVPLGNKVRVVNPDTRHQGAGDLAAMSKYPVLSIANSTFSWWAATIASARGAAVVAPPRWSTWNEDPRASLYMPAWDVVSIG